MKRRIAYLLFPMQLLVLMLVPRFGWSIYSPVSAIDDLVYASTYREGGYTHVVYRSRTRSEENVDIGYKHRLQRAFVVGGDSVEPFSLRVQGDGGIQGSLEAATAAQHFLISIIVWEDSSGILYRMYVFALGLTLLGVLLHNRGVKRTGRWWSLSYDIPAAALLVVGFLISFRVIM